MALAFGKYRSTTLGRYETGVWLAATLEDADEIKNRLLLLR